MFPADICRFSHSSHCILLGREKRTGHFRSQTEKASAIFQKVFSTQSIDFFRRNISAQGLNSQRVTFQTFNALNVCINSTDLTHFYRAAQNNPHTLQDGNKNASNDFLQDLCVLLNAWLNIKFHCMRK